MTTTMGEDNSNIQINVIVKNCDVTNLNPLNASWMKILNSFLSLSLFAIVMKLNLSERKESDFR